MLFRSVSAKPSVSNTTRSFSTYVFDAILTGFIVLFLSIAGMALYHTLIVSISFALPLLHKFVLPAQTLISAFAVFSLTNPVHNLLALISVFFFVALFMLSLSVEFLSYLLLIIYVGAIAILFIFVIMLLDIKQLTSTPYLPT